MGSARLLARLTLAVVILGPLSGLLAGSALAAGWIWPAEGSVIKSYDGPSGDRFSAGRHRGIDIAAGIGSRVLAATDGEVSFSGSVADSGLTISIRTGDGRYDTSYLHLSESEVGKGDSVAAGAPIGRTGTTGAPSSSEPHLHFGVRDAGSEDRYRDPLGFFPGLTPPPNARPVPAVVAERRSPPPGPAPAPRVVKAPEPRPRPVRLPVRAPYPARAIRVLATPRVARTPALDRRPAEAGRPAPAPAAPEFGPIADARPPEPGRPSRPSAASPGPGDPGLIAAAVAVGLLAAAGLVALARWRSASSIDARWPTTSPRRSTT